MYLSVYIEFSKKGECAKINKNGREIFSGK
jgi:hypothetical protein